jgi:hypothetical protein
MKQSNYTKYFESKSNIELIEMKILHVTNQSRLEKNWFEALDKFLKEKGIDESNYEAFQDRSGSAVKKYIIDPLMIKNSGKALKRTVVTSLILLLLTGGLFFSLIFIKVRPSDLLIVWSFLGIINILGVIIIMSSVFEAGNQLDSSVKEDFMKE